jgi:hypothetical protein
MPIYEITPDKIVAIPRTSFAEAGLLERVDLQRLLREQIDVLSPDTLIRSEEFADWEDSKRRIDLLGIDRDANLEGADDGGLVELIARAVELHGEDLVNDHIKSASQNATDLNSIRAEALLTGIARESRQVLGKAARTKKAGWFKSVTRMEDVARDIVGPDLENADAGFNALVDEIFAWAGDAGG